MPIRVEFYGIARQRAGISQMELKFASADTRLADVLSELQTCLPRFGEQCLAGGRLNAALAANLDGQQFVSDLETPIRDGQCLLILSADAGG